MIFILKLNRFTTVRLFSFSYAEQMSLPPCGWQTHLAEAYQFTAILKRCLLPASLALYMADKQI